MNANLPPPALSIRDWLKQAAADLKMAGIPSPRLDAEIILAHTLRKSRTYLHARLDERLSHHHQEIADARLELRRDRTPVAYIIGHKEFYGRRFMVTPSTLIPRPESEEMITLLKEHAGQQVAILGAPKPRLVDVGTGTGCLGITAKLELGNIDVTLIDIDRHTLKVAEQTAKKLGAEVTLARGDLLTGYPLTAQYILANLPYVDPAWERSPELRFEPEKALFATNNGLYYIFKLLEQAPGKLASGGRLLLEADPRQHEQIIKNSQTRGLTVCEIRGFIICLQKS